MGITSYNLSATTGTMAAALGAGSTVFAMRLNPTTVAYADFYSETNSDTDQTVRLGAVIAVGQAFNGANGTLIHAKFNLKKLGAPTGNIVAKIYAMDQSYGASAIPIGAALATSANVDITTLTTSYVLTTFTFSGANQIVLRAGTRYVVTVEYSGGDVSNNLVVGHDGSSPSADGNFSTLTGSTWTAVSGKDLCFYVGINKGTSTSATINRIILQYTTIVAFTTAVTAGRSLAIYRGSGAAASGGTAITTVSRETSLVPPSQFESGLGGDVRIASTGALTVAGITYESAEFRKFTLSHVGTAGAFVEFETEPNMILQAGELLAIRNPIAMDAAGTWQLNVMVEWTETNNV